MDKSDQLDKSDKTDQLELSDTLDTMAKTYKLDPSSPSYESMCFLRTLSYFISKPLSLTHVAILLS